MCMMTPKASKYGNIQSSGKALLHVEFVMGILVKYNFCQQAVDAHDGDLAPDTCTRPPSRCTSSPGLI